MCTSSARPAPPPKAVAISAPKPVETTGRLQISRPRQRRKEGEDTLSKLRVPVSIPGGEK